MMKNIPHIKGAPSLDGAPFLVCELKKLTSNTYTADFPICGQPLPDIVQGGSRFPA